MTPPQDAMRRQVNRDPLPKLRPIATIRLESTSRRCFASRRSRVRPQGAPFPRACLRFPRSRESSRAAATSRRNGPQGLQARKLPQRCHKVDDEGAALPSPFTSQPRSLTPSAATMPTSSTFGRGVGRESSGRGKNSIRSWKTHRTAARRWRRRPGSSGSN